MHFQPPDSAQLDATLHALRAHFGERFSDAIGSRRQRARGEGLPATHLPDAVVWPESTDDVAFALRTCHTHGVPIIAFGTGTSLEGQVAAPFGGISLDMSRMDRLLAVHAEDGDCVVQPGITREALNSALRDTGLYFPIDPGANASLGGMISTRASGTTTVCHGTIADNVLALEAVLADGRVIRCGTRARKSAAGYDLVRLFTGSEGTLGIITEATLRLYGRPEAIGSGICSFDNLRGAVDAVIELIQLGAPLGRIEFLDDVQVRACNRYSQLDLPERPTLFIEFNGTEASVAEQFERAQATLQSHGGGALEWASDGARRAQLWKARHAAYFAARAMRPDADCIVSDVCVPISALAECVEAARRDIDAEGLLAPIVGHVGDGNFHVLFLIEPGNAVEQAALDRVYDAMIARAHAAGGTCTGEHGIGLGKRDKLLAEFGDDTLDIMRGIKTALDPRGILNPGKLFP